jgi:aspartate carbamoyltransferase regulatory subunit
MVQQKLRRLMAIILACKNTKCANGDEITFETAADLRAALVESDGEIWCDYCGEPLVANHFLEELSVGVVLGAGKVRGEK